MKNATVVIDLGYGDSGKGTMIDAIARKSGSKLVVRFNGGAQAAHTVVLSDGREHTFHQFGSASFNPDTSTYLSEKMLFNPIDYVLERAELLQKLPYEPRVYVHENCLVTTPYHMYLNQIRELALNKNRHGSCGKGIGETMRLESNQIRVKDLNPVNKDELQEKLIDLLSVIESEASQIFVEMTPDHEFYYVVEKKLERIRNKEEWRDTLYVFKWTYNKVVVINDDKERDLLSQHEHVLFEGAQGILLDQDFGIQPYNTWSKTTSENARAVIDKVNPGTHTEILGVIRTYMTRHGAGPFDTESEILTEQLKEIHNPINPYQERFRCGTLDYQLIRSGIKYDNHITGLLVTCLDRFRVVNPLKISYALEIELKGTSYGPTDSTKWLSTTLL